MLSKCKFIRSNAAFIGSLRFLVLNKSEPQSIYSLSFCTTVEQNNDSVIEKKSPGLPGWVKFMEKDSSPVADSDDDFVIPSIVDWAKKYELPDSLQVAKNTVNEAAASDVKIVSKVLKNRYQSPDDVALALQKCAVVDVSESLILQLLRRFSNDWIPAFGVFKWAKLQIKCDFSKDVYDFMVDILGKSRKFHLMWEVINEMDRLCSGFVTLETMGKAMRSYSKAGKWTDAIEVFRNLGRFEVKRDIGSLNVLVDALVKGGSVEQGQQVISEFKDEIPPNIRTFNVLIHGWCKSRKLEEAYNAKKEMEEKGLKPDVVSYTTFVEVYCREKDFRKVDEILDQMKEKGCPPNVVTYGIYMQALGKSKEIRQALEVYEGMKESGCIPDIMIYCSLVFILGKSGRLKDAQDVFKDMVKYGVKPDVLTYNTMITLACLHEQEENALKLLMEMEEGGCKPDFKTYSPLLKMCCRKKRMKVLAVLLNHMLKNDVSPEHGTYTLLVHGLCKNDKLEHACLFFEEMVLKGFLPKDLTHKLLTKHLEAKKMAKEKKQIEMLMLQAKEGHESDGSSEDHHQQAETVLETRIKRYMYLTFDVGINV